MNPDIKPCRTCTRLMSADDQHHRCQRCRRRPGRIRGAMTRLWARDQLGRALPEGLREYGRKGNG